MFSFVLKLFHHIHHRFKDFSGFVFCHFISNHQSKKQCGSSQLLLLWLMRRGIEISSLPRRLSLFLSVSFAFQRFDLFDEEREEILQIRFDSVVCHFHDRRLRVFIDCDDDIRIDRAHVLHRA